jgi:hypothetical protein
MNLTRSLKYSTGGLFLAREFADESLVLAVPGPLPVNQGFVGPP